jgi:hypothetical protein
MRGTTIEEILEGARSSVEKNQPVSPTQWLDAAQRLNALIQNLDERLVEVEMIYRRLRAGFIEDGKSATESETRAKSSDAYGELLKLKAKKDQVDSFIQIAKKRCEIRNF